MKLLRMRNAIEYTIRNKASTMLGNASIMNNFPKLIVEN